MADSIDVRPYDGPELVYGDFDSGFSLVVLHREWAEHAAAEFQRWLAVTTWREALVVARSMTVLYPPVDRQYFEEYSGFCAGEDDEDEALAAPFDPATDGPGRDELTWPTFPCDMTGEHLPSDWPVGQEVCTVHDGEKLMIDPSEESRLLEIAAAAGAALVRDDDLVNRLFW